MTLILDRRDELHGAPGIHAFICGVSFYHHIPGGDGAPAKKPFGLKQLSSTATTGWLFHQWLLDAQKNDRLPLELATVHLLLSPSQAERDAIPEMGAVDPASRENFVAAANEWRDFASNADGMTIFYFAGHGVQRRQNDSVLLLDDFGKPPGGSLTYTVDVANLFDGMAPPADAARKVALKQLYFIDACRMPDKEFKKNDWMNVPDLWDVDLNSKDDRSAPVFYAAIPGTSAFAVPGGQTLFSFAIKSCLDRVAAIPSDDADPRWRVTTTSVISALDGALNAVNKNHQGEQKCLPVSYGKDMILTYLTDPPAVDCVVSVEPDLAANVCEFKLTTGAGKKAYEVAHIVPHPHPFQVPGGFYNYAVVPADPQYKPAQDGTILRPRLPELELKVKVST